MTSSVTVLDVLRLVADLIASDASHWPFSEAAHRLGVAGRQVHREAYMTMFAADPAVHHNSHVDVKLCAVMAAIADLERES